jgi:hypothetical protein
MAPSHDRRYKHECYEENDPSPTRKSYYKFKDIADMLTHLGKATAEWNERAKEVTRMKFTSKKPDSQTSNYAITRLPRKVSF